MARRGFRGKVLLVGGLVLLAALPAITGHPILSYPVSRSMEPTLAAFDVFLVEPLPRALRAGDIILFHSELQGGPAVHRIVGGDASGWLTKGDANPDIDQLAGEPVVTPERILGRVVVDADGAPIVIPKLGIALVSGKAQLARAANAVGGASKAASLAFLALAAVLAFAAFAAPQRRARARPSRAAQRLLRRLFPRGVLGRHVALALLAALLLTAGWAAANARTDVHTSLVVVSEPTAAEAVRAAAPGGILPRDLRVSSLGFLPTLVVAEPGSAGILAEAVHGRTGPWGETTVTVHERAGERVGLQRDVVAVWRYPALLPDDWTLALHRLAPGAPYAALVASVVGVGAVWLAAMGASRARVGPWLGIQEEWL